MAKKNWIEENPKTSAAIGIAVLLGVSYNIVLKPILEGLGISKSDEEINVDNEIVDPASAFSPQYWQKIPAAAKQNLISDSDAKSIAFHIWDSVGIFSDDFSGLLGLFKQLRSKADVSYVAYVFQQIDGDLLTWLLGTGHWPNDHYSATEVNQVLSLVKKLPNY